MSRKNDSKNQNDGEFLQRKGPYLADNERLKKQGAFEKKDQNKSTVLPRN